MIQQKLDYLHNNPVVAGFVRHAEDYLYSSAIDYYTEWANRYSQNRPDIESEYIVKGTSTLTRKAGLHAPVRGLVIVKLNNMMPGLIILTKQLTKNPGADEATLNKITSQLDFRLPEDYLNFLKESNGGEGFVGTSNYLSLWKAEDLIEWNSNYNVDIYAPGYFIFASDGGGTAYAFNKNEGVFVSFQFIEMLMEDAPIVLGDNFQSFLNYLYQHN